MTTEIVDARGKKRVQTHFKDKSMTVQSDAHLADIQEIMKSYGVLGMQQMLSATDAQFMDVSEFTDYADMQNHVREAEATFMRLPSKVREKFGHDVYNWLDAAHEDREAADVQVAPVVVPIVAPPTSVEGDQEVPATE